MKKAAMLSIFYLSAYICKNFLRLIKLNFHLDSKKKSIIPQMEDKVGKNLCI